ncbi:Sodium/hydrogen exchanger [Xylariaceae sp. FL0016]|nr:Sodium/hydrogen exchanger [Xylariaceae sp. FL0016]
MEASFLAYHEPSIAEVLILASFLVIPNLINSALDRTLYCGLLGQVLVGIAWGFPGANWLSEDTQRAVLSIGYLGLILIVFEGGVSTDIAELKRNIGLSIGVAITGIACPVGLNFVLSALSHGATGLQCFAAGAALCSTSLGTTFLVLSASGLTRTRLGSVLSAADMMDDVVGLVMVQVVASLGGISSSMKPKTVLRPILVSLAFAIIGPLACLFVLKPCLKRLGRKRKEYTHFPRLLKTKETSLIIQTGLLFGLDAAAGYAGAFVLLAAYIAGVVVSWLGMQLTHFRIPHPAGSESLQSNAHTAPVTRPEDSVMTEQRRASEPSDQINSMEPATGVTHASGHQWQEINEMYYSQAVNSILKPFFFANSSVAYGSYGSHILFRADPRALNDLFHSRLSIILSRVRQPKRKPTPASRVGAPAEPRATQMNTVRTSGTRVSQYQAHGVISESSKAPSKPLSLYPSGLLSFAMVARGEIGFLISSVAESNGIFRRADESSEEPLELFLIVTWAIFVCTIIGPLCRGMLVRRVKKLEAVSAASRGPVNVLGVWDVQ